MASRNTEAAPGSRIERTQTIFFLLSCGSSLVYASGPSSKVDDAVEKMEIRSDRYCFFEVDARPSTPTIRRKSDGTD
jgi:hypothetical protein